MLSPSLSCWANGRIIVFKGAFMAKTKHQYEADINVIKFPGTLLEVCIAMGMEVTVIDYGYASYTEMIGSFMKADE